MKPRTRRARAILRDRRRGFGDDQCFPIIRPLTGYDLYLMSRITGALMYRLYRTLPAAMDQKEQTR